MTDIGSSAFQDCSNLTSVTIGTSVKEIEMFTFRGCSNLKDIIIPANVDKIGQFTFEGCEKLISVTNLSEIPQKIDNTQFSVYGDLHVKKGCKEAYLASEYWSMFNIIEDAEELTDIETLSGIDNNVPIYNLRGQQLNSLQKGFNIMNGRKVYVK